MQQADVRAFAMHCISLHRMLSLPSTLPFTCLLNAYLRLLQRRNNSSTGRYRCGYLHQTGFLEGEQCDAAVARLK